MMKYISNSFLFLKLIVFIVLVITIVLYSPNWILPSLLEPFFKKAKTEDFKSDFYSKPDEKSGIHDVQVISRRPLYRDNVTAFIPNNATTEVRNGKRPYLSPKLHIPVRVEKFKVPVIALK